MIHLGNMLKKREYLFGRDGPIISKFYLNASPIYGYIQIMKILNKFIIYDIQSNIHEQLTYFETEYGTLKLKYRLNQKI
jgi:hypothetical protein